MKKTTRPVALLGAVALWTITVLGGTAAYASGPDSLTSAGKHQDTGHTPVVICHRRGHAEVTITVDDDAVNLQNPKNKHLGKHDRDTLGPCATTTTTAAPTTTTTQPTTTTTEATTTTTQPTTTTTAAPTTTTSTVVVEATTTTTAPENCEDECCEDQCGCEDECCEDECCEDECCEDECNCDDECEEETTTTTAPPEVEDTVIVAPTTTSTVKTQVEDPTTTTTAAPAVSVLGVSLVRNDPQVQSLAATGTDTGSSMTLGISLWIVGLMSLGLARARRLAAAE